MEYSQYLPKGKVRIENIAVEAVEIKHIERERRKHNEY